MKNFLRHIPYYVQYLITILFVWKIVDQVIFDFNWAHTYNEFGISDWLINYQGGFVRRGLIGEMLWQIYQICPYPLMIVVKIIALCAFISFIGLSVALFYKNRWSLLPLLFPLALAFDGVVGFRRDFLMMLFAYFIFESAIRYIKKHEIQWIIISIFLNCLAIVIYEPTFFFTTPILFCLLINVHRCNKIKQISRSALYCVPAVITMGIVCLHKGNAELATNIWESWMPAFYAYPDSQGIPPIGDGVDFLHRGRSAFMFHINLIFHAYEGWYRNVISNILYFAAFPMIYFVVTRVPYLNYKLQIIEQNSDKVLFSSILIIQLVSMLPMFTILSCDLGRTIPYCIYTTFFIVHLLHKHGVENSLPAFINRISATIQSKLDAISICNSFWFYLVVLLAIPMRGAFGPKIRDNLFFKMFGFLRRYIHL